jgi:hypothetical protein
VRPSERGKFLGPRVASFTWAAWSFLLESADAQLSGPDCRRHYGRRGRASREAKPVQRLPGPEAIMSIDDDPASTSRRSTLRWSTLNWMLIGVNIVMLDLTQEPDAIGVTLVTLCVMLKLIGYNLSSGRQSAGSAP